MLRVKTSVKQSTVHGLGLYAEQLIPKGMTTWQYDAKYDVSFTKAQIEKLPELARQFMQYYCYFDKEINKYILCADNQRYINHSFKRMNIQSTPIKDVAIRDIHPGEELFCDYHDFDDNYFERMGIKKRHLKD